MEGMSSFPKIYKVVCGRGAQKGKRMGKYVSTCSWWQRDALSQRPRNEQPASGLQLNYTACHHRRACRHIGPRRGWAGE